MLLLLLQPVHCLMCSTPCMSPVTYALHQDQNEGEGKGSSTALGCPECRRSYPSPLKFYTGDKCGDNAIPKNVKMFVNNTITSAGGTFFLVRIQNFLPWIINFLGQIKIFHYIVLF